MTLAVACDIKQQMNKYLKFLGYLDDMSSNPMKMYLMCVSQYLCEKCLLQQYENFPNDIYKKNISRMKITILCV